MNIAILHTQEALEPPADPVIPQLEEALRARHFVALAQPLMSLGAGVLPHQVPLYMADVRETARSATTLLSWDLRHAAAGGRRNFGP